MSDWVKYGFHTRIRNILTNACNQGHLKHHFESPFLSAYQIAIEYDKLYNSSVKAMGYVVGGKGSSTGTSLSQYIAKELSTRIKDGSITDIEGSFLSNQDLEEIRFNHNNNKIISSVTEGDRGVSIFRMKY